jgi:hypothetical protein
VFCLEFRCYRFYFLFSHAQTVPQVMAVVKW